MTGAAVLAVTASAIQPLNAQMQMLQPTRTLTPAMRDALVPIQFARSRSVQGRNFNEATIAAIHPLGTAPLLSSFRLHFENGDHKIRRIGIIPNDRTMIASLSDGNGDDPFEAGASWYVPSHGVIGGSVTKAGGGVFDIDIPRGPEGSVLVLSGFNFARASNSDANIRSLAVKLDSASSKARVTMLDDQGMDFTALAGAAAVSFGFGAIGGPIGSLAAGPSSFAAFGGFAPGGARHNNRFRRYTATVHYAWVPSVALGREITVTGTGRTRAQLSGLQPLVVGHVLTGFSFHFQNSDHYLLNVGVHLRGLGRNEATENGLRQVPRPESFLVSWQDNDTDDPMRWSTDYRELNRREAEGVETRQ